MRYNVFLRIRYFANAPGESMRLVTRSDFDGLVCGVLLKAKGLVDSYAFVHPKDLQDGLVPVTEDDILVNVAYTPGCGMWFDHHSSEMERVGHVPVKGRVRVAPSCARVVWEYFGGAAGFDARLESLLEAVDKVDSGRLAADEVNNPHGWILLAFLVDPRTGMQRQSGFSISGHEMMVELMEACGSMSAEEVLALPDVKERIDCYIAQEVQFRTMLEYCSVERGNVLVIDMRGQDELYTGNRFTVYALYPDCNVSIQVMWGYRRQRVILAVGHSIINRGCTTDIGKLMLNYGGGGHARVGTCQVPLAAAEAVLEEITGFLQE